MTSRFTPNRMTPWRQRFLAIARELDASPARRRGPMAGAQALREAFLARGSLRGIRLGCVRTA
ncbi:MAG TPA: hypothetical protein VLJ84_11465 [Usitatibacter sp.]|nr:hypothetical protein [Usitatibacter sp.]